MNDVTRILSAMQEGEKVCNEELLVHVYAELRRMAAGQLARERPGQTLDATALVHEAFLRMVGTANPPRWENRRHFFGAAAEAMRRILIEQARRKAALKRGGGSVRADVDPAEIASPSPPEELLALDEALGELEKHHPEAATLVKLRYFAAFSHQEAAEAMNISRRAADRLWALARAWLLNVLTSKD